MMKLLLSLVILAGCAASKTKLSSSGEAVKELYSSKPSNCNVLDKVVGENDIGSQELAKNHARNLAGKKGGNGIYFNEVVRNGNDVKVYSTVYTCEE